jgi:hypothetical protein
MYTEPKLLICRKIMGELNSFHYLRDMACATVQDFGTDE